MKKIILSAIIAACALTANAQVWLGGELGLTSLTEKLGGNELQQQHLKYLQKSDISSTINGTLQLN